VLIERTDEIFRGKRKGEGVKMRGFPAFRNPKTHPRVRGRLGQADFGDPQSGPPDLPEMSEEDEADPLY